MKLKLKKHNKSPIKKVSELIPVETTNGNKAILKATVIGIKKSKTNENQSDYEFAIDSKFIKPPLSIQDLSILKEYSSELGQTIESMVIGVEGFGQRLMLKEMTDIQKKYFESEIKKEKEWLDINLIKLPNLHYNLTSLRKNILDDIESTGNAYIELLRPIQDSLKPYTSFNKLESSEMRITIRDKNFTTVKVNYVDSNFQLKTKIFYEKFRRFVQVKNNKLVFFKEFRDPRIIDKRNGEVANNKLDQKYWATEVFHFKLYTTRDTPYGIPRYTGNIIAIKGSRTADEANILTQQNNNVPSMAILVSGGMLTEGSINRVEKFVDQSIKGDLNYSKFLILEGESTSDGLSNSTSMKIEIKPLTNDQHTDALWQTYDEKNADKIRRSFRLPSLMTGDTKNLNRATAQESERLAEKYVYNPIRETLDNEWNKILLQQGIKFWQLKTNSPNVTNDEDLVKILSGAEKSGALTPRIARMILEDIFNKELPPIKEDDDVFDPDLPFSMSLAKMTQGMANANREGTLSTQGQNKKPSKENGRPKENESENDEEKSDIIDNIHNSIDPDKILDTLILKPDKILEVKNKSKLINTLCKLRDSFGKTLDTKENDNENH